MCVGVLKDKNLKLRELHVSDTMGDARDWNT
jgi:hypothetical protein